MNSPRENRMGGEKSLRENSEEYQHLKCGDREKYLQRRLRRSDERVAWRGDKDMVKDDEC